MANSPLIFETIRNCGNALTWVAIIICAYLWLDYLDDGDDDPDGYA